ncbi:MAG: SDR family oxidoreductase [Pirellulaceae bacterium]
MTKRDGRLNGKSIVIVGGTSGLGLSAARACAAAGARLILVGRNRDSAEAAKSELGDSVDLFVGDACDPVTAKQAIALAESRFGSLDALYHVAGGSGRRFGDGPLDATTDDGIVKTLQLNLQSVIYSNRAAVQAFLASNRTGTVLNMGSVLATSPAPRHFATHIYAAAKAGIEGLTRGCAAYYAVRGIRFNVIAPALAETPMSQRASNDEAIQQYIRTKQPLDGGRIGQPQDLDEAVVYLLSDASKYMTGQVVTIDGGWSVSEGQIANES